MISLSHIEKNYGLGEVLTDFSMTVHLGERVGLIGANGSGKSTIFKLISGIETPDSGVVAVSRNLRIGLLSQIPEREAGETVEERLWKGVSHLLKVEQRLRELEFLMGDTGESPEQLDRYMKDYAKLSTDFEAQGGYTFESKIKQISQGLGLTVPLESQVIDLSGGELARLQLAVLLLTEAEVLLLDEPTNHLDFSAIHWLEEYLNQQFTGTVIVISHDRYFLDRTIRRVVEVNNGKSEEYPGNYSYYLTEREIRYENALKAYENQQKEIRSKEEAIKRIRTWAKQADNKILFKRARAMERQLERIEKVDRPLLAETSFQLQFGAERSGKEVFTMKGVSKSFGDRTILKSIDLQLFYGQRVGLIGPNGAGKSTILKMILQELNPDEGQLTLGANLQIGYFDQNQEITDDQLTILDSFRKDGPPMSETTARNTLAHYGFTGDEVFKLVKDLSGGERSRFILLKMVHSQVNLLILDEPTNHLDLPSIEILEESLSEYSGTLLVVSHDRYFINKVVNEVYVLQDQGLDYYAGNYDYYQRKVAEKKAQAINQKETQQKTPQKAGTRCKRDQDKEAQIQQKRLKKELIQIEEEIAQCELRLEENSQKMIHPEVLQDYKYLQQLTNENEQISQEMSTLWVKWEELCILVEEED